MLNEEKKLESSQVNGVESQALNHVHSGKCRFAMADRILCLVLKVIKVIVFIALAYVLFDLHGILSHAEHNMNAAESMPAGVMMQPGAAGAGQGGNPA